MGVVYLDAAMCDIFFEVEVISERFKVESKSVVNFLEQSAIDYREGSKDFLELWRFELIRYFCCSFDGRSFGVLVERFENL